ncbi:MAG: VTT domain-containing protein [Parcubacteria group bacterium]
MLATLLAWLYMGRYFAIYLGAILEGPIVMTATGFFIKMGIFYAPVAYVLLLLGDLTSDVIWYYIGYAGANKYTKKLGNFIGLSDELTEKIKYNFKNHEAKILFISKLTMGFGFSLATLMTAGAIRVKLGKYLLFNFLGELFWVAFLLTLGYFIGNIYVLIDEWLRIGFAVIATLILVLVLYGISRRLKKKI